MTLKELKNNIERYNIPDRWYSIDQGLNLDCLILYKNYSMWEYFYFSENGERLDFKLFNKEQEAYEHLWNKLKYQHEVFNGIY